jgi:glutamate--cysteine ligase
MTDTLPGLNQVELDPEAPLGEVTAEAYVGSTAFKTGPPSLVGVELEWLVYDLTDPVALVPVQRVRAALGGLSPTDPLHSHLTMEPGGQLELSSPPAPLAQCLDSTAAELARLRHRLGAAGLRLGGYGLDPVRAPVRQRSDARYVAMERHFDRRGFAGRLMMCSTASVQVCLDAGTDEAEIRARWHGLYTLAPTLVALFANSPLLEGRPTGWRCSRQAIWSRIDPTRTRPPADVDPGRGPPAEAEDPRAAYARYALDAQLLAVRRPGRPWVAPAGLTFRSWLRGADPAALGPPRLADLDYHLSTLFPPVRPRGHLELRVLDAQQGDRWELAAAVVAAVLDDPVARDAALAAAEPMRAAWTTAARHGLADHALARAGAAVLAAAIGGIRRAGLQPRLLAAAEAYADRFPARRRSPSDDLLEQWRQVPARQPGEQPDEEPGGQPGERPAGDPGRAGSVRRSAWRRPTAGPAWEGSTR